ncbi:CLUMA_CG007803, isoform A [Clunio marinus]|uniref:CLUMA_CG007803, isoform A n=1 Tax=Clunio marinus TaxID=568069 RepID=A0A1J1I1T6_9DIPT|nr:CLUMA_CG007803, isoform A [Clunio marinus]
MTYFTILHKANAFVEQKVGVFRQLLCGEKDLHIQTKPIQFRKIHKKSSTKLKVVWILSTKLIEDHLDYVIQCKLNVD